MAKFLTIGYGDQDGYDRADAAAVRAAHANDARLRRAGALIGIAGAPIQVRNPNDRKLEILDGPFMASSLPLAGFALIDAATMAEAIESVSRSPCAVAFGVIEVWPLEELA